MQTIGERLEEARKKKGISIREAAEATKIRGDYLQKFESNHFDLGIGEIYNRGFLRTYANFLKLPADRIRRRRMRPRETAREHDPRRPVRALGLRCPAGLIRR
jgi:cytoskeletal protein RodZ